MKNCEAMTSDESLSFYKSQISIGSERPFSDILAKKLDLLTKISTKYFIPIMRALANMMS